MKKQNVLNLIKYHVERDENSFRNESVAIARYFDSIGDCQYELARTSLYKRGEASDL